MNNFSKKVQHSKFILHVTKKKKNPKIKKVSPTFSFLMRGISILICILNVKQGHKFLVLCIFLQLKNWSNHCEKLILSRFKCLTTPWWLYYKSEWKSTVKDVGSLYVIFVGEKVTNYRLFRSILRAVFTLRNDS